MAGVECTPKIETVSQALNSIEWKEGAGNVSSQVHPRNQSGGVRMLEGGHSAAMLPLRSRIWTCRVFGSMRLRGDLKGFLGGDRSRQLADRFRPCNLRRNGR